MSPAGNPPRPPLELEHQGAGLVRWIGRPPSGLLVPTDLPELTIEAAIDRRWRPEGHTLLLPIRELREFLPTFPATWRFYLL